VYGCPVSVPVGLMARFDGRRRRANSTEEQFYGIKPRGPGSQKP
jgi:hypothetical protein